MSSRSLAWPLAIMGMMLMLGVMMLMSVSASPQGGRLQQSNECEPYPTCQHETETAVSETQTALACGSECQAKTAQRKTALACEPPIPTESAAYPLCKQTETAEANRTAIAKTQTAGVPLTQTALAAPSRTPTNTTITLPTNTVAPTPTHTPTATATSQATSNIVPTLLATPTIVSPAGGVVATAASTPTGPPLGAEVQECQPGVAIRLTGDTSPQTALLLLFNEVIVGGGISDGQGRYDLVLVVGEVRGGLYPVLIEERRSGERVRELYCRVPDYTPTPTRSLFFFW